MEVITRKERRRIYSEAEKAAVVAEASVSGVTVREVSRRLGIAESLIYNWRSAQRKAESIASEPLQFISYGVMTDAVASEPNMALTPKVPASAPAKPSPPTAPAEDLVRPHPGGDRVRADAAQQAHATARPTNRLLQPSLFVGHSSPGFERFQVRAAQHASRSGGLGKPGSSESGGNGDQVFSSLVRTGALGSCPRRPTDVRVSCLPDLQLMAWALPSANARVASTKHIPLCATRRADRLKPSCRMPRTQKRPLSRAMLTFAMFTSRHS
ncbi:transposase [Sphingomonas sp. PB2P19]